MIHDMRVALRSWRTRPGTAIASVLILALGAGCNIAVFALIWSVMLEPLPYRDADRLAQIWIDNGKEPRSAPANTWIEQWRSEGGVVEAIAAYRPWRVTIASNGDPQQVVTGLVSPGFFDVFGARPVLGRMFEALDGASTVVLSEEFWRRRFRADPGIVGAAVTIDGEPCRVTGVVADSFRAAPFLRAGARVNPRDVEPAVYLPLARAKVAGMRLPQQSSFAIARVAPGVPLAEVERRFAPLVDAAKGRLWLSPLDEEVGRALRPALLVLLAATACVLLIACANLANLLLARAAARRREYAVRAALGASRARVIRESLTESGLLAVAGGGLGVAVAAGLLRALTALYPGAIARASEGGLGPAVYGFAFLVASAAGLLLGALPAWSAASARNVESLRTTAALMQRGGRVWASVLVGAQVGLTAAVLIGAGLLVRTFSELRGVDTGLVLENTVTASVDVPGARYKTKEDRARFGAMWLERVRTIPGVTAAAVANSLPIRYTTVLDLLLHVPTARGEQAVGARAVTSDYFAAMGMQFVEGGLFDPAKPELVINEAFRRKYLPPGPAVGVALPQPKGPSFVVTGVVRDVRHFGPRERAKPEVFVSFASWPLNPVETAVRSKLPADQIAAAMRSELRALDPALAVDNVMTMSEAVDRELAGPRFQAVLLGLFSLIAAAVSAVGVYAVVAHDVRGRTAEIGLRRALGATTADLLRMIAGSGLRAPVAGLAAGLAGGAIGAGRYLGTLLFGVKAGDPGVIAVVAVLLAAVTAAACAIPGWRAARVDPARALRSE